MSRCATSRRRRWPRPNGCARRRSCRRACASPPMSPTSRSRITTSGFATNWSSSRTPTRSTCCSTMPASAAAAASSTHARAVGTHLQHLLGRRLSRRAHLPAAALEGRRGPHRQHLQRQRLLGVRRHGRAAHRLLGRQIRGEGFYRSADQRPSPQRAAHQMLGGDARPYRHLDRRQFAHDPERQRGADAERSSGDPAAAAGHEHRHLENVRRGHPEGRRRSRPQLSRGRADLGGAGRQDHPRRRQGREVAHPGRRRCATGSTSGCGKRRSAPTTRNSTRTSPRKSAGGSAEPDHALAARGRANDL